ncbi:hypothetical protein ETAA8_60170 [Anatilimnocola aggregata]|uniref:RapA2 cadherin-like domain-containing protein n=1 Tax=Anatilimnocola aggregata TaxID=2528021 RepID=A0A517YKY4_9BACT|nr:Ig-like domain-containing protein [Anatilimnocola aggregata]QDU30868.1 hypothetical protein ETAA8_60170 [Anatilimnocola aggregata]
MAASFFGRNRSSRTAQQRRRTFLTVESLEERTVLAGNIAATVSNGYLNLTGDSADNRIEIMRSDSNDVTIRSLDGTTRINGQDGPITLSNVSKGIIANTGDGDDELDITGSSTTVFRVLGDVRLNTGNGDDIIRFTNFSMAGSLTVTMGAGEDQFYGDRDPNLNLVVNGLRVSGVTTIDTGADADLVSIQGSYFNNRFLVNTNLGNDTLDIRTTRFNSLASLNGSSGTDRLNRYDNSFGSSLYIYSFETRTNDFEHSPGSNLGPTVGNDTVTVAEGGSVTVSVLTNDTANNGTINTSSLAIVQQPARGSATVNTNGTITYVNNGSEIASDTFTYTVRDSLGNISNTATVAVTVTPINDIPVAGADSFTIVAGTTTALNLAANDTDAEGRLSLGSIVIVQQPTNGTIGVNANGTVSFTQNGTSVTSDSFRYTIADLDGGVSLPVTVNLTITPAANTAPTIGTLAGVTTNEDTATGTIAVSVNDAETAAAALVVTATSSNQTLVPNGSIAVGGSGTARTLVITPAANLSGTSTITVTVSDGTTTSSQSFLLTVNAVNDAPTIQPISDLTLNQDTASSPFTITLADLETPNGLTVSATSSANGVVAPAGVSITGSGLTRTVIVTPVTGASGTADITLTVSDGTATSTQTFTVDVSATNQLPTVSTLADVTTTVGTTINPINVTVGDAETAAGSLTVSATSNNQALILNNGLVFTGSGSSRVLTITPVSGATGTANVTVTVNDGSGGITTDTFVVTINAAPANTAPTITSIGNQTIAEDGVTSTLAFTIGDAETPLANLQLSATSSNTNLVSLAGIQFGGSGGNRTVVVTPLANASGSSTITVTVSDGTTTSSLSFLLTVNAVNDAPTIQPISDLTLNQDTPSSPFTITLADLETPNGLTVTATSSANGVVAPAGVSITGSGLTRTVVVTPVTGASGTADITLTVSDGSATSTQTFTVDVSAQNQLPTVSTLADVTTTVGTTINPINVTVGDAETAAGSLTVSATSNNQSLILDNGLVFTGSGSARVLTITPVSGATGTANVTVTVNDGSGGITTEVFAVTINAAVANTPPTISAIADQTIVEDGTTGALAFTIGDTQTPLANLLVTATSSNTNVVPLAGIQLGGSGGSRAVIITPAANAGGTADITITVSDGMATATETFTVTVTSQNDAPTISSLANVSVGAGETINPISITVGDVESSTFLIGVTATSDNQALIADSGLSVTGFGDNRTLTITPVAGASGTANVTVSASDGSGGITTETFTVTIGATGANIAPVAANRTATVAEAGSVNIDLGAFATDADGTINVASIVVTQNPTHGTVTVNANGTVTYVHDGSELATDTFQYTISDAQGTASAPATVSLTITPVNDAPVAMNDHIEVNSDVTTAIMLNVLDNDIDVDTEMPLNVTAVIGQQVGQSYQGMYGTIQLNSNGTLSYTIDQTAVDELMAGEVVEEFIIYRISDGSLSANGLVNIDIRGV